ncbi:MAG: hypothetical protein QOH88_3429 [Verrucomicrobiota bacterium]|jgi:hypothetical protein
MAKPDVTEPAPADECRESEKVDKVINVIVSEFEGDTSRFFESIRPKEDEVWRVKSKDEMVAVRKVAGAHGG